MKSLALPAIDHAQESAIRHDALRYPHTVRPFLVPSRPTSPPRRNPSAASLVFLTNNPL